MSFKILSFFTLHSFLLVQLKKIQRRNKWGCLKKEMRHYFLFYKQNKMQRDKKQKEKKKKLKTLLTEKKGEM